MDGHTSTIVGSFYNADTNSLPKNGTLPVGWDDGTNPPTPFTLEVGESLIDTRNGNLWCFTPGSNITNWTNVGEITGPPGADGKDGEQGRIGEQGQKGEEGLDGSKGEVGPAGRHGLAGLPGDKGEKGAQGSRGPDGFRGPVGPEGQKGSVGEIGYDGDDGEKGEKGQRGEKGQNGLLGHVGPKGEKGTEGKSAPPNLVPVAGGCFHTETWEVLDEYGVETLSRTNTTTCRILLKKGTLGDKPATVIVNGPKGTYFNGCSGDALVIKHRADTPGIVNFVVYQFSS